MPHVTFVHGIANKPDIEVLLRLWHAGLARDDGIDLGTEGITSSMVYWADVVYEAVQPEMAAHESNDSVVEAGAGDIDDAWQSAMSAAERQWLASLESKLQIEQVPAVSADYSPPETELESATLERIPLPWWLKQRLMKILLRDVHHYLFNTDHSPRPDTRYRVQDEIRRRMLTALRHGAAQPGPHIIVAHSMGTVISYDCLKRVADCPRVDGLITVGSPLGLDEVQDKLQPGWSREDGFPDKLNGDWVNIYDRFDPVAGLDPVFANDYKRDGRETVRDINEQSYGVWRHSVLKYFEGAQMRAELARLLEL